MSERRKLSWKTSSRSSGGNCVQVAVDAERVLMRDSKDPAGPVLAFGRETFRDFIAYVKEAPATGE